MMRGWGALFIVSFGSVASSYQSTNLDASLQLQSRYHYNVYYNADDAISDMILHVVPKLSARTSPGFFSFKGDADATFDNYTQETVQNQLSYRGLGKMVVNEDGATSFAVTGEYRNFSDPSPDKTHGRIPRDNADAVVAAKFKAQKGNSIEAKAHFNMDNIDIKDVSNPTYLNSQTMDGTLQYNNAFLPETFWFLRGTGGAVMYPNGVLDPSESSRGYLTDKNNSFFGSGEAGVEGRLTEKSTIDFASGYLIRVYDGEGSNWSGPIFYLRFTEQVTRRDQLMAGYNYSVKESYWTNYVLDQEIYLGLARVMGDQLLILGRASYSYRSYSTPARRDDQRIAGALVAKYSISPTIKLVVDLKLDLLSSDAFKNVEGIPDAAASYKSGSLGLGVVATY